MFDLQSRHEINGLSLSNITKGDNAKSKNGRVVILVCDMSSGPVLHFCQVPSKYSKGYYRVDTKSLSNKTKGDNSKPELSILYATCHLILIYISTRYYQNILKGIQVTELTRSFTPTSTPKEAIANTIQLTLVISTPLISILSLMSN